MKKTKGGVASLKVRSLAIALCLIAGTSAAFVGLSGKDISYAAGDGDVHIWTTYNDYLVLQDPSSMTGEDIVPPEELAADEDMRLDVTMGKGETEGAQIILSPKKDVSSYDIVVSDLLCGGNKIEAKDIEVYNQAYIYAVHPDKVRYASVPQGWYPDMLVPFERAKAVGENKVSAGKNQGITVNFRTLSSTKAGTYTGSFTLTVDGTVKQIPVSVTVRDIDLTNMHVRTVAAATGDLPQETYEMLMNDYRVSLQYPTAAAYSPDVMVEKVAEYWDNPHFTNYEIPNNDVNMFKAYVKELAKASYDVDHNYLTRATCYLQNIDESKDYEYVANTVRSYMAKKNEVKNELVSYFTDSDLRDAVYEAIDNLVVYITASLSVRTTKLEQFQARETGATLCAEASILRNEEVLAEYQRESTMPMWLYANFEYPDIGTSILNYGQALRTMGWNMARYDMGGYLFWDINQMLKVNGGSKDIYQCTARDYYSDALSFAQVNNDYDYWNLGDGALVYPAKKYGEPKSWYGSLRLANFRDGLEDHEALYLLEQEYKSLARQYGVQKSFDEMIGWVYEKGLSTATSYYADNGKTVYEMRDIIFDLYDLAKSKKLLLTGITVAGDTATAEFYTDADQVKVNGDKAEKEGDKYRYSWTISSKPTVAIELDSEVFLADVFDYGTIKSALNNDLWSSKAETFINGADGDGNPATVMYVSDSKKFHITIKETENKLYPLEAPVFRFYASMFGHDDIFDIYYLSFKMRIRFRSEVSGCVPLAIDLEKNSYQNRTLNIIEIDSADADSDGWIEKEIAIKIDRLALENASSIAFVFKSYHLEWYHMGADVEISDVHYTDR